VRKRFLIVHNPNAGSGRRRLMERVIHALERDGCAVTVLEAVCAETGRERAAEAARTGSYDAVVAAGGDGTIRSVATGLRGTDVPVALLPLGTGNVMAHEIGLKRDAQVIATYLREGPSVPVIGAMADGRPFFLMAGAGLDADAVSGLNMGLKRRIGKLAYVWPVVRAVFRPPPAISVVLDGTRHDARWVVAANARSYAGGFCLSPDSHLFEPGLVAVLCTARNPVLLIVNILMIGAGLAKRAPHLRFVHFRRAQFSADRHVAVQVDGEPFGELPLTISQDSMSVHVIAPPGAVTRAASVPARAAA